MKTVVKEISPAMAEKILKESNTHNRPISEHRVATLAADMKSGSFLLTHQGIAFDNTGTLVDGQHRLRAIVDSRVTVRMMVTTDIPREHTNGVCLNTIDVIDCGGRRTVGQQLTLAHGVHNGNRHASAVRVIAGICAGSVVNRLSTAQTLRILEIYGDNIGVLISVTGGHKHANKSGVVGALAFCRGTHKSEVDDFAGKYASMEQIPAKSAITALFRRVQSNSASGSNAMMQCSAWTTLAVMKFIERQRVEFLRDCDDGLRFFCSGQKVNVRLVNNIVSPPQTK